MRWIIALLLMATPALAQEKMSPSAMALQLNQAVGQMALTIETLQKQNQELTQKNEELQKQLDAKEKK